MLASNNLTELADLDVLGKFPRLTHLVLMDNPVTKKEVRSFFSIVIIVTLLGERTAKRDEKKKEKHNADFGPTVALPILGCVALPDCAFSRLPKGQAGGAREGERFVWHREGADGVGVEGNIFFIGNFTRRRAKKKKITMMLTFVAGTDHGHQILDFQRVDI